MEIMNISPRKEEAQDSSFSYDSAGTTSGLGRTGSESGSSSVLCEENNTCVNESGPLEISGVLLCPGFELSVHI